MRVTTGGAALVALSSLFPAGVIRAQGPLDPEVAATVERVLAAEEHPGLTWRVISDVTPALRRIYDAEPDRLFWLDGDRSQPALEGVLSTLAAAGEQGLDPADYDATRLADQWDAVRAGSASATDRALLDLGLSVAAARFLSAGHRGRVDPTTMAWGYAVARKQLDLAATLRDARSGKGLAAALAELEPPFPHYWRARRALAAYRAIVAAGEPEPVPALGKGRRKVVQKPGPKNSLGRATFILPKADDIYMHGTPARQLLSRARRDFSHGCIRLEDPVGLAEWCCAISPSGAGRASRPPCKASARPAST